MKFCRNCGNQMDDNAVFCAKCGTAVNGAAPQQPVAQPAAQPAPAAPVTGDADVQQNRGIAWLAYCGLLLLVPLFARKRSEYCQFHVKQGATLLALEIVWWILDLIVVGIVKAIFPGQLKYAMFTYYYQDSVPTIIFNVLFSIGFIFIGVLAIIGIVNAASGKKNKLFLVGDIPFVGQLMDKIYASLNKNA